MDNMGIWNEVCKTDPAFTKKVTQRGGYTSISPQYQTQEATKVFGPYGKGWGFSKIEFDFQLSESGLVLVDAVFFYVLGGECSEFPIKNAWQIKQGQRVDPDFAKKAETNTLSKALSKLGFSADVFMGQFDDMEYVHERTNEALVENAANKDEAKAEVASKTVADCERVIEQIGRAKTTAEVEGLFKAMARRIHKKPEFSKLMIQLTKTKDEAKERLQ